MVVYLYVGRQCDQWFLNELFHVTEHAQIDKHMAEEEIFAPEYYEKSVYLTSLYSIINGQLRPQRQPFCELRVLVEGDAESDAILRSLLVNDGVANAAYPVDFAKFLSTVTGHAGGQAGGTTTGAATAAGAYY